MRHAKELLLFMDSTGRSSLQVFYMGSLLRTSEFSVPVSTNLKFILQESLLDPQKERQDNPDVRSVPPINTKFVTFDMKLEKIGGNTIVKGKS